MSFINHTECIVSHLGESHEADAAVEGGGDHGGDLLQPHDGAHLGVEGHALDQVLEVGAGEHRLESVILPLLEASDEVGVGDGDAVLEPNSIDTFWHEFWFEKTLEFWLGISLLH